MEFLCVLCVKVPARGKCLLFRNSFRTEVMIILEVMEESKLKDDSPMVLCNVQRLGVEYGGHFAIIVYIQLQPVRKCSDHFSAYYQLVSLEKVNLYLFESQLNCA